MTQTQAEKVRELVGRYQSNPEREDLYKFYAAMEAVIVEDADTARALAEGLASPAFRAALACAQALGKQPRHPELTVMPLARAVEAGNSSVQPAALDALACYSADADAAVPLLVTSLQSGTATTDIRRHAVTLGKIGTRPELVVPALLAVVRNDRGEWLDPADGEAACRALGSYATRDPRAWRLLCEALGAPALRVREAALDALTGCGGPALPLAGALLEHAKRLEGTLASQPPASTQRHGVMRELVIVLERLFPFGERFEEIVLELAGGQAVTHWSSGEDALAQFVASEKFGEPAVRRLAAYLSHADGAVRARVVGLLARAGVKAAGIVAELERAMRDPVGEVAVAAAATLGQLGNVAPAAARALERIAATGPVDLTMRRTLTAALVRLGLRCPWPVDGIDARNPMPFRASLEGRTAYGNPVMRDGTVWFPVCETVAEAPADKWLTDAERFGAAGLSLAGELQTVVHWLPFLFSSKPSGGNGRRRTWRLTCPWEGGLVFSLESPFADERGWGTDNFLFFLDRQGTWSRLLATGSAVTRVALGEADPEAAAFRVCGGEAIVWPSSDGTLSVAQDATPYHLEDSVPSQETRELLARAREARATTSLAVCDVKPSVADCWRIEPAGLNLYGLEALSPGAKPSETLVMEGGGRRLLIMIVRTPQAAVETMFVWTLPAAPPVRS